MIGRIGRRVFVSGTALMFAALLGCGGQPPASAPESETPVADESGPPKFDPSLSDPQAIEVAQATYDAMGGKDGFDRAAQIKFRFVVERDGEVISAFSHAWDRKSGRYRLEGTQTDGKKILVYFNVYTYDPSAPVGTIYISGRKLDEFEIRPYLEHMYGRFINDTYWLLMPSKLLDPGVVLKYDGETTDPSGDSYDILYVTFLDGTGITPKDQYWAYINRRTHLMDRWEYILQGDPKDAQRTLATWEEWNPHGSLVLATRREFPDRPFQLMMADLEVSDTVDPELFVPPEK